MKRAARRVVSLLLTAVLTTAFVALIGAPRRAIQQAGDHASHPPHVATDVRNLTGSP
jgi:hypothetical protein